MFSVGGEKPVYGNGCKLNLMVWRGGISRILCCYKYVKVVLTCVFGFLYITRSVSLVYICFLRNAPHTCTVTPQCIPQETHVN